jgi:hypothetical protein
MAKSRVRYRETLGDSAVGRWVERLTVAACAGVLSLIGALYNNMAGEFKDLERRVRDTEQQQAVSTSNKADIDRRLNGVESELKDVNVKLDKVLENQAKAAVSR